MNPAEALARWLGAKSDRQTSLDAGRDRLEAHRAMPCNSPDPAEHRRWMAVERELEAEIAVELAALRSTEERAAEAEKVAERAAKDLEERRVKKDNDELAKLTLEVAADGGKLAAKLERMTALRSRVDEWNAGRGDRPFIEDGETKLRGTPATTLPAQFEEREVYEDDQGEQCGQFVRNRAGDMVPADSRFTKRRKRVQISPERYVPASAPAPLADAIRLVDLKGNQIWPAR